MNNEEAQHLLETYCQLFAERDAAIREAHMTFNRKVAELVQRAEKNGLNLHEIVQEGL